MRVWQKLAAVLLLAGLVPLAIAATVIADGDAERLTESARAYHLATAEVVLGEARGLVARALAETRALGSVLARVDEPAERREASARAQLLGAELVDQVAVYSAEGQRLLVMRTDRPESPRWAPPDVLKPAQMEASAELGYLAWEVERRSDGTLVLPLAVPIYQRSAPTADDLEAPPNPNAPNAPPTPDDPSGDPAVPGIPKIYAFLVVDIALTPLSGLVGSLGVRHFDRPERVRLIDEQLRIIAAADADTLFTSLRGKPVVSTVEAAPHALRKDVAYTVDYVANDDVSLIGAIVPVPELGWAALVEQDQAEAYASVAATWRTAAWVGVAAASLALLIALLLGRRMARPIEAIAAATSKVASGDFAVRVPAQGNDEIGKTALAFNKMAGDLGTYRDKLVSETRARENLSRFLSPEVVDRIVSGTEALKLGGERREITVMFADVVSFTTLADEREPEVAVALLNELFTIITEIVFQHGGIIDKFIGDCAMALWGAPEAHEDDARRAVRAAEAILRWLEVGNARWRKQLGRDIELAIGIHTGTAVVGNVGSEKRMEYTAIGDAVNVAARLERLARPGQILMTRETMQRVADEFPSQSIGTYNIVGRARPSEIYVLSE
jgi:class 3 adenylate cyclase